jgi:hypothetical protein
VFGQGGIIDAAAGFTDDLQALASGQGGLQNVLGAVQTAGTAYNTFKNVNLAQIAGQEVQGIATNVLQQGLAGSVRSAINAGNGQFFPNARPNPATGQPNNILSTAGVPTLKTQLGF